MDEICAASASIAPKRSAQSISSRSVAVAAHSVPGPKGGTLPRLPQSSSFSIRLRAAIKTSRVVMLCSFLEQFFNGPIKQRQHFVVRVVVVEVGEIAALGNLRPEGAVGIPAFGPVRAVEPACINYCDLPSLRGILASRFPPVVWVLDALACCYEDLARCHVVSSSENAASRNKITFVASSRESSTSVGRSSLSSSMLNEA